MSGVPGTSTTSVDTAAYLAHAVAAVHEHGFVPARPAARPAAHQRAAHAAGAQPTWQTALERLERHTDLAPRDVRRAHEILGWAASLHPRDPDGYRARLQSCLAAERLSARELPLAASAVRTFNVHLYYEIRGRRRRELPAPHVSRSPRADSASGADGAPAAARLDGQCNGDASEHINQSPRR